MKIKIRDVTGKSLIEADLDYSSKRVKERSWVGRYIVNSDRMRLYAVPQNMDHMEFLAVLFRATIEQIKKDPMAYSHFVGIGIVVEEDVVTGIIIGLSGFETEMANAIRKSQNSSRAVRYHTVQQLQNARALAYDYILGGEFPLAAKGANYKKNYSEMLHEMV